MIKCTKCGMAHIEPLPEKCVRCENPFETKNDPTGTCPDCGGVTFPQEGCMKCPSCGWNACEWG